MLSWTLKGVTYSAAQLPRPNQSKMPVRVITSPSASSVYQREGLCSGCCEKNVAKPSFSGLLLFYFNYIQPRPKSFLQSSVWINLSLHLDTKSCIWGPLRRVGKILWVMPFSPIFWLLITCSFFSFYLLHFSLYSLLSNDRFF